MANQPLAFGELLAGGILLTAALTGASVREVVAGNAGPFKGFGDALSGGGTATASTGTPVGGTQPGSPLAGVKPAPSDHPTSGLTGYPAHDYMAPAGATVVAPATGTVTRLSGHDPATGPTNGVHGPFGLSAYITATDGTIYYLTHLGSLLVHAGQQVTAGMPIGTVGDYAKWGGVNHVHQGVHTG